MTAGFEIGDRWVNNHTGDVARMTQCEVINITTDEYPNGKGWYVYTLTYEDDSIYKRNALTHHFSHVFRCDEPTLLKHWSCLVANDEQKEKEEE